MILVFFNSPFFIIVGGFSTIAMVAGFLYTVYLILCGVLPVWYRLGIGLSKGKIAIFASSEFSSLHSMLVDSGIFKEKNIVQINKNELKKAVDKNIFLIHWKDFADKIDDILNIKKDSTALIIYAPQNEGRIDQSILDRINEHRNTIIVNLRGRLLNDVLTSLITVSYERK